jgi:hypothetical protein
VVSTEIPDADVVTKNDKDVRRFRALCMGGGQLCQRNARVQRQRRHESSHVKFLPLSVMFEFAAAGKVQSIFAVMPLNE